MSNSNKNYSINMSKIALAIHGGAGTIRKSEMTVELEAEYRNGLQNSLLAGWQVLQKKGSALDAVEASVVSLEDFPLFNAGRGSVFTNEGKIEMDASLMDGKTNDAGAVAFVKNVKNPIKLARLILEKTEHIFLAGDGAVEFARQMNVELADDAYFFTEHRYQQLLKARQEGVVQLDHTSEETELIVEEIESTQSKIKKPIGTVGAVACDYARNLAAATSTGGMTNKQYGRIGDTPIVGAGTYADNRTCAVSCTGHGEYFMKTLAAFEVSALMKYKDLSLQKAAFEVIEYLRKIGGEGGLIAVDVSGNLALPFNSEGMYRAFINTDTEINIEIYT